MAEWSLDTINALRTLCEDWFRASNLGLIVPVCWLFSLGPMLAAWRSQRRGRISYRKLIAVEIAWLSLGVAGTALAWWFWYLDYRRRIPFAIAGDFGVSAYLTVMFIAALTVAAQQHWRRGESLFVRPLLKALLVAATLALSFVIIMVAIGLLVFFVWGPWPDEVVSITCEGVGIGLHVTAVALCWHHLSHQETN